MVANPISEQNCQMLANYIPKQMWICSPEANHKEPAECHFLGMPWHANAAFCRPPSAGLCICKLASISL